MIALQFLWPAWWPLLLALPLLALAAYAVARHAERRRARMLGARLPAVAGRARRPRLRALADSAAVVAVGVALLHPVVPGDEGDGGVDVVLCVDVSWSMAARDAAPSRLGFVQREIAGLLGIDAASRIALVTFAGDAELAAPPTDDLAAIAAIAGELEPGTHGRAGSDPGAAIDRAVALLRRSPRCGAIVVLSDGEDFAGGGPAAAARALAAGFEVHAFGCGDPAGSKIVVAGAGGERFLRDGSGADVVTRLEVANLRALAAAGGGDYRALQPGGLRELHDRTLLPAARASAVRAGRLVPVPLFHWPLLAAFVLWMLRWCVRERRP